MLIQRGIFGFVFSLETWNQTQLPVARLESAVTVPTYTELEQLDPQNSSAFTIPNIPLGILDVFLSAKHSLLDLTLLLPCFPSLS